MSRTKFRQTWMAIMAIMLLATSYAYNKYQSMQLMVNRANSELTRLQNEKSTGDKMTAALVDLNTHTLDEAKATKLEIMRYLGIEQTDFTLVEKVPVRKNVGGSEVTVRLFDLDGVSSYSDVLRRLDLFHEIKKVSVHRIEITPTTHYGDLVNFKMEGAIYGLQK